MSPPQAQHRRLLWALTGRVWLQLLPPRSPPLLREAPTSRPPEGTASAAHTVHGMSRLSPSHPDPPLPSRLPSSAGPGCLSTAGPTPGRARARRGAPRGLRLGGGQASCVAAGCRSPRRLLKAQRPGRGCGAPCASPDNKRMLKLTCVQRTRGDAPRRGQSGEPAAQGPTWPPPRDASELGSRAVLFGATFRITVLF